MRNWYVAYTKANAEFKALTNLTNQGFTTYLPRHLKQRRHARKTETIASPLFPRYLFVQFDREKDFWHPLLSTIGLSHLVSNGNTPTPINDAVIETIRAHENAEGIVELCQVSSLKRGAKLRVISGPFADMVGLFDGTSSTNRINVLLNMLGGQVRVELPPSLVMNH